MNSRDKILQTIKKNQPKGHHITEISIQHTLHENELEKFKNVLQSIGGMVMEIDNLAEIKNYISKNFPSANHIISAVPEVFIQSDIILDGNNPHRLKDIDIALLKATFGVAENGSVWITHDQMVDRALPFICENLILTIEKTQVLPTMHEAYEAIGNADYDYGTFIAGPSKTADIEQSLVLGAHGPKTLTVCLY